MKPMRPPRRLAGWLLFLVLVLPFGQAAIVRAEALGVARTVRMVEYTYDPKVITVAVGEPVTWRNAGKEAHTATLAGVFDTGRVEPGAEAAVTFDQPGTYRYVCQFHGGPTGEGMNGTVIVSAAIEAQGAPEVEPPANQGMPEAATMPAVGAASPELVLLVGMAWLIILLGLGFRLVEGFYFI